MIIFSNTVPQPAVNPFYRDCSEIEPAVVFLMIYSLIQFQSFCNPYNCSCYSERRNLRLLRTFKKIKLKIKWPCRKQISSQVVVSVILVYRCKEIELSHPLVRPLKLGGGRPKAGS